MAIARIRGKKVGSNFSVKNAINVALAKITGLNATNVQEGIEELHTRLTELNKSYLAVSGHVIASGESYVAPNDGYVTISSNGGYIQLNINGVWIATASKTGSYIDIKSIFVKKGTIIGCYNEDTTNASMTYRELT